MEFAGLPPRLSRLTRTRTNSTQQKFESVYRIFMQSILYAQNGTLEMVHILRLVLCRNFQSGRRSSIYKTKVEEGRNVFSLVGGSLLNNSYNILCYKVIYIS